MVSPIRESVCFTAPGRTALSENATSRESAVSIASVGARIRTSSFLGSITTPENCPVVSIGLSNQSFSCWMEWIAAMELSASDTSVLKFPYILFRSSREYGYFSSSERTFSSTGSVSSVEAS